MPRAAFVYSTALFGRATDPDEGQSAPAWSIAGAEQPEGRT